MEKNMEKVDTHILPSSIMAPSMITNLTHMGKLCIGMEIDFRAFFRRDRSMEKGPIPGRMALNMKVIIGLTANMDKENINQPKESNGRENGYRVNDRA